MRCGLPFVVALLILVPAAAAAGATPVVSIQATPTAGAAPLHVTFSATGDAVAYHWDFGDGGSAEGRVAEHTYAAGRWTATLTAYGLTLAGPNPARYGRRVAFRGAIVPAEKGLAVALVGPQGKVGPAKTDTGGRYTVTARVRLPGEYVQ